MYLDIFDGSLKHFRQFLQCFTRLHGARVFARSGRTLLSDAALKVRRRFAALRQFDRSHANILDLRQSINSDTHNDEVE